MLHLTHKKPLNSTLLKKEGALVLIEKTILKNSFILQREPCNSLLLKIWRPTTNISPEKMNKHKPQFQHLHRAAGATAFRSKT